jgi:HEAT repeat protein
MNRQLLAALGALVALAGMSQTAARSAAPPSTLERSLVAWLGDLKDRDVLVREEAVEMLGQMGTAARAALPELKKLVADPNRALRTRAALALWRIGGDARPAVAVLTANLRDGDLSMRREALLALGQLGTEAVPAANAIVELLDDSDVAVRSQAGTALTRMARACLPAVLRALQSKEVRLRRNAAGLLAGSLGYALLPEHLPPLAARLKDEDLAVRVDCARLLWIQGQADKAVVTALLAGVQSPDATLRSNVLSNLVGTSPNPRSLLPLLDVALKSADMGNRVQAARILWDIEKKPDRVLPVFLAAIKGTNRNHWPEAVIALGEMGPAGKPAAVRLVEMLKLHDYYPYQVRTALRQIGPEVIPAVVKLLEINPPLTNYLLPPLDSAIDILGNFGKKGVDAVGPLLGHADPAIRTRAVRVLGAAGPGAVGAVPRLITLLDGPSADVRDSAIAALGNIGAGAKGSIPKLVALAKGSSGSARTASLKALEQIGVETAVGLPLALAALKDKDLAVRQAGLDLLLRLDPKHKDLLPAALELLKNQASRSAAMAFLGRMGAGAALAVPRLVEILEDPNDSTCREAADALGQIGSPAKEAVGPLLAQLGRADSSLCSSVITALRLIEADPRTTVGKLVEFIKTNRTNFAVHAAATVVGEYGPRGAEAATTLLDLLRDPTTTAYVQSAAGIALVRVAPGRARKEGLAELRRMIQSDTTCMDAARALLLLDETDKEALEAVQRWLKSTSPNMRGSACWTLAQVEGAGKRLLGGIRALLADSHYSVRGPAAWAVWRITGDPKEGMPTLQTMLADRAQLYSRTFAAYLLSELGPAAKPALPALLAARNDPDSYVRRQVEQAIKKVSK